MILKPSKLQKLYFLLSVFFVDVVVCFKRFDIYQYNVHCTYKKENFEEKKHDIKYDIKASIINVLLTGAWSWTAII